jgi:hypothetical protein
LGDVYTRQDNQQGYDNNQSAFHLLTPFAVVI